MLSVINWPVGARTDTYLPNPPVYFIFVCSANVNMRRAKNFLL